MIIENLSLRAQRSNLLKAKRGQTALILILLTAAALILLSITLNWGRIAQSKNALTIAADQAASLLASDAASYGESQKQANLGDCNTQTYQTGGILAIIEFVIAIIILVYTCGAGSNASWWLMTLAWAGLAAATVNLVIQLVVIQPGITTLWNGLQKDEPIQQQFYEGGVAAALQGSVTDRTNITDYLDSNANGVFGNDLRGNPLDAVSRFAFFYTDRLKMLHQGDISQVDFFYSQLGEFVNGETCLQNWNDYWNPNYDKNVPLNPNCIDITVSPPQDYCGSFADYLNNNPSQDPRCQGPIQNGFQLNDSCTDSDPTISSYNPSCDPCCQPLKINGKSARPTSCDQSPLPLQCLGPSNPYLMYGNYAYLYDSAYQEYANGISFLDQYGRDEQLIPPPPPSPPLPVTTLTPQGSSATGVYFPNGVYPFFWLMNYYSPEVDNIDYTNNPPPYYPPGSGLPVTQPYPPNGSSMDLHWCAQAKSAVNGVDIPSFTTPTNFPDLAQLSLPYTCHNQDCCVNFLPSGVTNNAPAPGSTTNGNIDMVGSPNFPYIPNTSLSNPAADPIFGEPVTNASAIPVWLGGDNQMCSPPTGTSPYYGWPYNGNNANIPDGICEWNNAIPPPPTFPPTPPPPPAYNLTTSTVDNVDETMHAMSDFSIISRGILSQDLGTLSATFNTWYPQVATWIAPACGETQAVLPPACNSKCDDGGACNTSDQCSDGTTCAPASDGRLVDIYNPYTGSDRLNDWNAKVIIPWLNTSFTPPNSTSSVVTGTANPTVWCVPVESATPGANGLEVMDNGVLTRTAEDTYITANTAPISCSDQSQCNNGECANGNACSIWGDLSHVVACLNYNAGPTPTQQQTPNYINYQNCLTALTTSVCADYKTNPPPQCGGLVVPLNTAAGTQPSYDGCTGTANIAGNFETWVNNNLNYGARYNFQQCQNALPDNSSCPHTLPAVCSAEILGRSLAGVSPNPFNGNCNPTVLNSFAKWVNDSLILENDEAPKFIARWNFLDAMDTTAQAMQNTFSVGDRALHNFFKTCNGCPGIICPGTGQCTDGSSCVAGTYCNDSKDTSCPAGGGICQDSLACKDGSPCQGGLCKNGSACQEGSKCGSPTGQCEDGGPAAQLMYAATLGSSVAAFPNSVIYGWKDNILANGQSLSGNPPLGAQGYAHLIRVTAYAPGRAGVPGAANIQSQLPWVQTTTGTDYSYGIPDPTRTFTLTQRDGYVYVSIQRWDQEHASPVTFPNQHTLWQMMFHNPTANLNPKGGLPSVVQLFRDCSNGSNGLSGYGFGLETQTRQGLTAAGISPTDQHAISNAFMINDIPNGKLDPLSSSANYSNCIDDANALLNTGVESHACAEYVASINATGPSCAGGAPSGCVGDEQDYSLKFVDCNTVDGGKPRASVP